MTQLSDLPPSTDAKPAAKTVDIAKDSRGATSAEYAFLLLIVVAAVALGLAAVGSSTTAILSKASTAI